MPSGLLTLFRVVVADLLASFAHHGFVVNAGFGGDLTENHHHTGLGAGLARDLA